MGLPAFGEKWLKNFLEIFPTHFRGTFLGNNASSTMLLCLHVVISYLYKAGL
jgi:hypothetical protein